MADGCRCVILRRGEEIPGLKRIQIRVHRKENLGTQEVLADEELVSDA
jgi:hypothetical protein